MRISDWSSDVCSSDLFKPIEIERGQRCERRERERHLIQIDADVRIGGQRRFEEADTTQRIDRCVVGGLRECQAGHDLRDIGKVRYLLVLQRIAADRGNRKADILQILRSEEHTSELQSLMRISYAVFCLKKKKQNKY